jgi:hypothetical protein
VLALDLIFKLKGVQIQSVSLREIRSHEMHLKLGNIKAQKVQLFNVFRGVDKTYEGYNFYELLSLVYGPSWQQNQRISFTSLDGYHQSSPMALLLKETKDKTGYLAFKEEHLSGFLPFKKSDKTIDPGPLYLVWSHFSKFDKASHGDIIKWPYQLAEINID